jgi:hypothetical protein
MSLTYGYDLKTYNDELIKAPVEINKVLEQIVLPGAVLINHIPFSAVTCYTSFILTTNDYFQ